MTDPETFAHDLLDRVIDRRAEASRVADFILAAKHRFVVLHGKPGSGKTELITRWVIPALRSAREREGYDVLYGSCAPGFPDVLQGMHGAERFDAGVTHKRIVFVDNFENVLDLPRDERRGVLDRLFVQLQAEDAQATAVLVTDTRQLTSVYALTSYESEIASAVLEVTSVGIAEGLEQLSALEPETAVAYSAEVLQRMSEDSAHLDVTFDLITLLDARFRRFRSESGERSLELPNYEDMDGLMGILRAHLEGQLEQLEADGRGNQEIARAILARVVDARARGAPADFTDIPPRLGASSNQLETVLARLTESGGLLRQAGTGGYQLVPPHLGTIIEEDLASRTLLNERAHRIVEEGLRSWQHLGTFLPQPRFEEVHRARTHLILPAEQIRFLLQCALRHEDAELPGASNYWLRRVSERVDGMDILLASLFDELRDVRARAATLLRQFPEPEVRSRLHILALTDPDPDVRAQAVSSLEPMQDQALMELFIHEAHERKSSRRAAAIEALRIFRNGAVANVLQALVNDPETDAKLREKAIGALSMLNLPQAVNALVDIALHDQDDEDRQAAAEALASIESEDLNRHLLSELRAPSQRGRIRLARIVVGLIALGGATAFFFLGVGGVALSLWLSLASLLFLIPTSRLLRKLRDQRLRRASFLGVLGMVLFAISAVSLFFWIRGLAHLIIGRKRRALALFGCEVLGVLLLLLARSWIHPHLVVVYLVAGLLLFAGSYIYEVVVVLFDTIVLTDTTRLEKGRAAIYRQIFANSRAAGLVFEGLKSEDPGDVRWARELTKRFGGNAQPDQLLNLLRTGDQAAQPLVVRALKNSKGEDTVRKLEALWRTADPTLQRKVAEILYSKPNERSLEALHRLRPGLGPRPKLRSAFAWLQFRVSLWPWSVRAAGLLLLYTAVVLVMNGIEAQKSPVSSIMMSLRQPRLRFVPEAKARAAEHRDVAMVTFLADHYPEQSAKQLHSLFREGSIGELSPVHAAIAQGLLKIQARGLVEDTAALRVGMLDAEHRYAELLESPDSARFTMSLHVLRAMADAVDSVLGDTAVRALAGFALRAQDSPAKSGFALRAQDSPERRSIRVITSLGRLVRYDRALPALDTLLTRVGEASEVADEIREQVTRATVRAYRALLDRGDLRGEGQRLLLVLQKLRTPPPRVASVRRELAQAVRTAEGLAQGVRRAEEATQVTTCDLDADGRCDDKDSALQLIADRASVEQGYRDLLNQYLADTARGKARFRDAQSAFITLKERYRGGVWPRKILAELYHEYLATEDTTFFHQSYDEMAALRGLPAYGHLKADTADFYRFEADFAEVTLSARHYAETDSVARQLLQLTDQPVYRLNLALFVYVAYVMRGDRDSADAKLARFKEVIATLPESFYNGWQYPGTVALIQTSALPEELRAALLKLCKEGYWYEQEEAANLVEENRSALKLLTQR